MIHKFCTRVASSEYVKTNYKDLDAQKIAVGLEIVLENITKVIIIMCCAYWSGILRETIVAITVFAMLRLFTFGMHSQSSVICTFISIGINVVTPLALKNLVVGDIAYWVLMLIFALVLYIYAPADTEKHPLLGAKKRKRLRLCAVGVSLMLMVFGTLIEDMWVRSIVLFMEMYVAIGVLPITYKIFKRRYHNYERYEKV